MAGDIVSSCPCCLPACIAQAFRLGGGLEKLLALLGCPTDPAIHQGGAAANTAPPPAAASSPSSQQQQPDAEQQQQQQRRLQRKVLALLQYVLAKHPTDGFASAEFGVVPHLQKLLTDSSSASDMRTATLSVLAQVVGTPQGWQWVKAHHPQLLPDLQQLQQQQQGVGEGEEGYEEEEVQLLQQLVGVLQAASAPVGTAQGLSDHIDLDPYQVGSWVGGWVGDWVGT